MNGLEKINVEDLLVFDIETVSANEGLEIDSREFELFQYKNRDHVTGEVPDNDETIKLYKKTAGLSAVYGKIVCISVGFINKNKFYYKALTGDEATIINDFYFIINQNKYKLLSYNGIRFDWPFIRLRRHISGASLEPNDRYSDVNAKPWELVDVHVDLMDYLRGAAYKNISLDEACYLFNVESPKSGEVTGSRVTEAFYNGKLKEIAIYCNEDIKALVKLFYAMAGKEQDLEFIDKTEYPAHPLKKLLDSNNFSEEIQAELKAIIKKKKLTKKDKENLFLILRGAWVKTDFINYDNDSQKVVAGKELEIKKFIDELGE